MPEQRFPAILMCYSIRYSWALGCSDFDFFHILRYCITTIPDTLRAQGFENWQQKNFNFIHGLWKFMAKTRKMRFFVLISKFNLGPLFDKSLPFLQHVLFMGSLIHIPKFRSLSQKL
jgi:hypothetical protein